MKTINLNLKLDFNDELNLSELNILKGIIKTIMKNAKDAGALTKFLQNKNSVEELNVSLLLDKDFMSFIQYLYDHQLKLYSLYQSISTLNSEIDKVNQESSIFSLKGEILKIIEDYHEEKSSFIQKFLKASNKNVEDNEDNEDSEKNNSSSKPISETTQTDEFTKKSTVNSVSVIKEEIEEFEIENAILSEEQKNTVEENFEENK